LSHEGAATLATLIKVQALKRHNEAWKDSLRYGRPDLDNMFGIRRITANANPLIGDLGVKELAEAFKSDLWLKALDLQNCGITTAGANYLLDGLKFNAMMHVLDVRLNVDIDRDTLQKIMEQVMINSSGNNTEYEWMDLNQTATAAVVIANSSNHSSSQSPK
jgi:centrosomal protein CEP78